MFLSLSTTLSRKTAQKITFVAHLQLHHNCVCCISQLTNDKCRKRVRFFAYVVWRYIYSNHDNPKMYERSINLSWQIHQSVQVCVSCTRIHARTQNCSKILQIACACFKVILHHVSVQDIQLYPKTHVESSTPYGPPKWSRIIGVFGNRDASAETLRIW